MSSSMLDWFLNTLTPTEPHVPSTAEIIQKCLNVNPFELKFREANMQINQESPSDQSSQQLRQIQVQIAPSASDGVGFEDVSQSIATSIGGHQATLPSMLKLPSISSQSPGIFSNINVLSADFEDELRKTINMSRKLRENRDDSKCEPRTADVIDGVIDVEFNRSLYQHIAATPSSEASETVTSSAAYRSPLLSAQHLIQAAAAAYGNQLAAVSMHSNNIFSDSKLSSMSSAGGISLISSAMPSTSRTPEGSMGSIATITSNTKNTNFSDSLSIDTNTTSLSTSLADFQFPSTSLNSSLSQSNLAAAVATTVASAFLQQHQNQTSMATTSSIMPRISPETLMALHSSAAAAVAAASFSSTPLSSSDTSSNSFTVPSSSVIATNSHFGTGAHPRSAGISPRVNTAHNSNELVGGGDPGLTSRINLIELKKTSSATNLLTNCRTATNVCELSSASFLESYNSSVSSVPSIGSDNYDAIIDVKPQLNKHLQQDQSSQGGFYSADEHSSAFSSGGSITDTHESSQHTPQQQNHHSQTGSKAGKGTQKDKPRKYTRYNHGIAGNGCIETQVTSTRGGRGRRSMNNDMGPDERRSTILERNKAAAVRYRKRKKEEHDEMIERVQELEQENNSMQTRNLVLVREIERLAALLKARDANCICRAAQIGAGATGGITDFGAFAAVASAQASQQQSHQLQQRQQHQPDSARS